MIIILPIILMQLAVAYIFFNAHWSRVTASLSNSIAAEIAFAVELYEQDPSSDRVAQLDKLMRPNMELSIDFISLDDLPEAERKSFFSNLDRTLRQAMNNSITDPFWFDTTRYPNHIDIRIKVDGGVLRFITTRDRVFAPTGFMFIFWLLTTTILLTGISILFAKNQARPIIELARAADAFGRGQNIDKFKPSGATEVRLAGHSFLKMRQRLQRQIEQRTAFLAGVSHDLRTPITRLKLHFAIDESSDHNAKNDLVEMEQMLEGYLDFARGNTSEKREPQRLDIIISNTLKKYSQDIEFKCDFSPIMKVQTISFTRAINNLVSNGLKYGTNVCVNLVQTDEAILIDIEDDGPGIPEDQRNDAFQAFHRLDDARNQNIEGVGLGLAIARDIIQSYGGNLILGDSRMGGLKAQIRLPLRSKITPTD
ncbi:MAG: ATP-binding protein [Maricaulaceae bacterium]